MTTDEALNMLNGEVDTELYDFFYEKLRAAEELAQVLEQCSGDKEWGKGAEPKIYEAWSNYYNAGRDEDATEI